MPKPVFERRGEERRGEERRGEERRGEERRGEERRGEERRGEERRGEERRGEERRGEERRGEERRGEERRGEERRGEERRGEERRGEERRGEERRGEERRGEERRGEERRGEERRGEERRGEERRGEERRGEERRGEERRGEERRGEERSLSSICNTKVESRQNKGTSGSNKAGQKAKEYMIYQYQEKKKLCALFFLYTMFYPSKYENKKSFKMITVGFYAGANEVLCAKPSARARSLPVSFKTISAAQVDALEEQKVQRVTSLRVFDVQGREERDLQAASKGENPGGPKCNTIWAVRCCQPKDALPRRSHQRFSFSMSCPVQGTQSRALQRCDFYWFLVTSKKGSPVLNFSKCGISIHTQIVLECLRRDWSSPRAFIWI